MEENIRSLLYFAIQEEIGAKSRRFEKCTATLYRCARKGKTQTGWLQYFYVPVPEYYIVGRDWLGRGYRQEWPPEKLYNYVREASDRVRPDEYYLHPGVRRRLGDEGAAELPPMPLLEVMTGVGKKYKNLAICLPDEGGVGIPDALRHLLRPYLPRVNLISLVGGSDLLREELEDYFYEEYGIVVNRTSKPPQDAFALDFWSGEKETLKFLDTIVKNGYNTKVN